jgi:hypothetical protein
VPDGVEVVFKIVGGIRLDQMLLQERIELPARGEAQEGPELVGGEAALALSFEAEGFEGGARGVLASGREGGGQLIGDIARDLHRNYSTTGWFNWIC